MGCGKAAGGGVLPVSFVAGRNDVIDVLTPGSEGSTFGGYPLGAVIATYAIKVLVDDHLADKAKERGDQLIGRFNAMKDRFPNKVKSVRGRGLLTAFEMHDAAELDGHHISVALLKKGVYAKETHRTTVRVAPALTISAEQIDRIADAVEDVIRSL